MIRSFLIALIFIISTGAQVKIFRNLNVEDGLLQSNVNTMFQDSHGYLWFGTSHGLSCWDGINFTNYHTINGLSGARINVITESENQELLIGTDNGLNILKNSSFKKFINSGDKPSKEIVSILIYKNRIFTGTLNGLFELKKGKFERLPNDNLTPGHTIHSIISDKEGNIYFVATDVGLIKYKDGFEILSSDKRLADLRFGNSKKQENTLYFITRKGFCKIENGKTVFTDVNSGEDFRCRRILISKEKEIFLATNSGVYIIRGDKTEIINTENGLSNNSIISMLQDTNGIFYFGMTSAGVAFYDGGRIFTINEETGLSTNWVFGITEGDKGEIYIGTSIGGLNIYDKGKVESYNTKNNFPSDLAIDLIKDNHGIIYSTSDAGLLKLKNKKLIGRITEKDGLLGGFFRCLAKDKSGKIYIVRTNGINILENNSLREYKFNKLLPANTINTMLAENENDIILGTEDAGLFFIKNNQVKNFAEKEGLANKKVLSLYRDSDNRLYVGTQGGLNIIDRNRVYRYNTLNGLNDNTIYGINEDNLGNIYLITNKGVNILRKTDSGYSIRYLTYKNGLAGDECNIKGIFKDSKGRMWFGTLKGVSCYEPWKDYEVLNTPQIHISDVKLFETSVINENPLEPLQFDYNENYLKFYFWGVNVSAPEQVKYQFRLTNVDPEWVDTESRFARYANLSNGEYTFEVRAKYIGGNWSKPAKLTFFIKTPFYKAWWFIAGIILFIGGTIGSIIYLRIRQVIMFERLRNKLAADLHDNIGAGLTEISILSEVIAYIKDRNSEDVTKNLNLISKTARTLVDNMSDIVWLVNPKNDSLYDLVIRLEGIYREIFLQKGIAIQSKNIMALEQVSLPMEYRQHLFLLFKEAMNNTLKHSSCTNVVLEAIVEGKTISMKLCDNGKGFDPNRIKGGHGIKNMYNRALSINGKLEIISEPGIGTTLIYEGKI